jgi:FkbM family methyltransferase
MKLSTLKFITAVLAIVIILIYLILSSKNVIGGINEFNIPQELKTNYIETCLKEVLFNLPYNPEDGKYSAHHYTAKTGKWNEEIRFNSIKNINPPRCIIMDVGGNTNADDTSKFLTMYGGCTYYVYEPIPSYYKTLEKNFKHNGNVNIVGIGWGSKNEEYYISSKNLKGQATFIMDTKLNSGDILLKIKTPYSILEELNFPDIDLLHINCEGCEWESLLFMGENDLFKYFRTIQFSVHNYGKVGVGVRSWELCQIKSYLIKTHEMVEGIPFGWERWEKINYD